MEYLLDDENGDEILARVQEESLRYYNDVELPRIQNESPVVDSKAADKTNQKGPNEPGNLSENHDSILCTQVGGKAGALLFDGEEARGFHLAAGTSYIYPTNFPIRQYQAAIVRSALFKNTLVSLPTGLGKTFIAAVVMYNFYRWFPRGKVVFMAPTRPLVAQQIKACYSIMGIPPDDTTEMTGTQAADIREKMWKEKRVFFLTPQVMANDLRSKTCPADLVKCLVVDEAHKAVKDYAYCQVIKSLSAANGIYRTLALSATPGNDINAVIQVINNLNICCLEMRGEDSIDVAPYTHGKSVEEIVVDLSPELIRVKDDFMQVYERFARSLIENRALTSNISHLSKFQILKAMEKFRANPPRGMSATLIGSLVSDFTMCMTFAHALELLQIYGLRAFYRYLADDCGEKSKAATTRLRNNNDLQIMLKKLHGILYPNPGSDVPYTWGHPKLRKLATSLSEHFIAAEKRGEKTKAIIFCNYKIVVNEIVDLLGQCKPHVKAALFVGQSGGKERGMPQAKQLQIMKEFRDGKINCLVATCVAEEGLDIGEVDLIVLMESQKSPVRLVQRLGRTGRKRRGRCIVLLTRGKEEKKFHEAMASRKSYVKNIVDSKAVKNSLCQYSPPMFPPGMKPQQQLVHINVTTTPTPTKPVKQSKKQMDIRECAVPEEPPFLDEEAAEKVINELGGIPLDFNRLPAKTELWHRKEGPKLNVDELFNTVCTNELASWNDWNTEIHDAFVISSTPSSSLYCHLLSYKPEEENEEYLRLIKNFEADDALAFEEANPAATSTEKVTKGVKSEQPTKKKIVPKKNFGMDIRSCMAAAVERASKKPRMDFIDDDVIMVDGDDDGFVDGLPIRVEDIGADTNTVEKAPSEKLLADDRAVGENQVDIAALFGMNGNDFENLLYGGELLCGLENDVGMSYRLSKYIGDPKQRAPKPKCMDENVFRFQCDQFLLLMDGVRDIHFRTVSDVESNPLTSCTLGKASSRGSPLHQEHHITRNESPVIRHKRDSETEQNDSNESFVGIDDLFQDDDQNVGDVEIGENPIAVSAVASPTNQLPSFDNIGEISPIGVKKNGSNSSIWGSNSVFAGALTPLSKGSNNSKAIVSSTPINTIQKERTLFSTKERVDEKDEWLLDDILEEEEMSKDDSKTKPDTHCNSSQDLFSSPPRGKVFQKSKVVYAEPLKEPSPKPAVRDDFEDDFWCMDDLLNDDKPDMSTNKNARDETTLYGITQMVSLIERDKKKNWEVIEILDSPSCSPVRNVSEDNPAVPQPSNRETAEGPSQNLFTSNYQTNQCMSNDLSSSATSSTRETLLKPSALLRPQQSSPDLKSMQEVSSKKSSIGTLNESKGVFSGSSVSTKKQQSVPIYVIDSDSNGSLKNDPQPSTSKELGKLRGEVANTHAEDTSCHSLLNEDDDIFTSLAVNENFVEKNSTLLRSVRAKSNLNLAKKKSSLMSHLDSESDNDFPPEKRDLYPEETMHLKVGSMSKRKLSFEDMLNELDDSTTSKYFASSKTTGKDGNARSFVETGGKSSLKLLTSKKPAVANLDEEDDIFIFPAQNKTIEQEQSLNESTTASSRSSPVKKIKKKKKRLAFIEREAEESGLMSSDDSDNSSLDQMDESFVNDESDHELNYTHYLKSVKSPVGGGKFKIPVNKRYTDDVYSQVVNNADDDYENDSFCVGSDEEHSGDETTILGLAERKLAKRKTTTKRIVEAGSDDTDVEDRTVDLESTVVLPNCLNRKRRRLLESDSDHTPDRVSKKRPWNRIVSPIEEDISRNAISRTGETPRAPAPRGSTVKDDPPTIRLDSDSDEEMKEAIRRSVVETKIKSPEERQFEEDLQKALLLSQHEVRGGWSGRSTTTCNGMPAASDSWGKPGPSGLCSNSEPLGHRGNRGPVDTSSKSAKGKPGYSTGSQILAPSLIDDGGTSLLFMSQPLLKDRPFSTKPKVSKPSQKSKKIKSVFELSDDSN